MTDAKKKFQILGLIKLADAETGAERWIDTSSKRVRTQMIFDRKEKEKLRNSIFIKSHLDRIEVTTGSNYIQPLVQFFRRREKRW